MFLKSNQMSIYMRAKIICSTCPYPKCLNHKTPKVPEGKEEENPIPLTWSHGAQLQYLASWL